MKKIIILLSVFVLTQTVHAATIDLSDNLSQGDVDGVVKDLSGLVMHTGAGPASSLGTVFGMELGIIAGTASVPNIEKASKTGSELKELPQAGLFLALSSMGVTGELNYLPSFNASGIDFDFTSLGLKWSLPEAFNFMPVGDLAVRAFYTNLKLAFDYQVDSLPASFAYKDTMTGLQGVWSKSFGIIEPYLALGFVNASGDITVTTTGTPFTFTGNTASSNPSSMQYILGAQLNLFFIHLGAEYSKQFDTSRMTMKLALSF